jgi:ribosomal-protein-alanine N-acetyltransferase
MMQRRALQSYRLKIRPLEPCDAKFVESLYADARVTRTLLRIQGPISIEAAEEFCRMSTPAYGERRFAAELQMEGNVIGVGTVTWRAELSAIASIGYSVLPAFWGQGYGTELAALLVEFAAGTLGAHEIRATALDDNPASTRVLEKLGFTVLEAASETDSRGDERRVVRWVLYRQARQRARAAEQQAGADRLDAGRSA